MNRHQLNLAITGLRTASPIMRTKPFPLAFATVLISIAAGAKLAAQDDAKPKPLSAGPTAYTQETYQNDRARFWLDMLLAECKVGDALRKEWQPHVETLMSDYAHLFCARIPGEDKAKRMVESCDRLHDLGCDDPVVQLVIAEVRFTTQKMEAARTAFAAAQRIETRASSLRLRFLLQSSLFTFHTFEKKTEPSREAAALRDAHLVALAASPEFGVGQERFYLDLALLSWAGKVGPDDLGLLERMEKGAAKPSYALLVLRSTYHNGMAWAARGQSAASAVSDTGRKGFGEHLAAAAQVAEQANQLCPRHPEAPTMMLKNLGPGGAELPELRRWFDLAVAAQLDWKDAYVSYMHYLQPRWGGSQQALHDFGLECLASARFDTEVPSFYRAAIHYITLGANDANAVWAGKAVQTHLTELDKGCIAAAVGEKSKRTANTHRIVVLALGGRAAEAAALCEETGRLIDPSALKIYGVAEDWLKKTLRPHFKDYKPAAIAQSDAFAGFATATCSGMERARPLTAHERAITNEQAQAAFAKWLGQTSVKAYERSGTHDAAWDEDARALLAELGTVGFGAKSAASVARAEKLLAIDCKDALTLYAVTRTLDEGDRAPLIKTLVSILPSLARDHSVAFSWWAKGHLADLTRLEGRPGIGSGLLPDLRKHLLAAIADPMFAGDDRRHYVACLWGNEELAIAGNDWWTDEMIARLGKLKGADPWLVHVVIGLHNARKAKHANGSERERKAQLKLAAEHLTAAHQLCPQFPQAAMGMIIVASLEPGATSPREWFDRALDAQIDYLPAFAAYVDALRPRYGGSIQVMYRFAVECLDTGRFDTDIPLWYAWTMQRIQEEVKAPRELWASAGVAPRLDLLFRGYEAKGRKSLEPSVLNAGRCVLAWAGGRYDDALVSWLAADKKLDERWLKVVGVQDAELIDFDLKFLDARRSK